MNGAPATDIPLSHFPDPPRPVRPSGFAVGLRLFLWVLTGLMMIGGVRIASSLIDRDQRLAHGARTSGKIVAKQMTKGSGDSSDLYRLDVRFRAGSRTVTQTVPVGKDEYERYAVGAPATVTYVPGDEAVCRLGVVTAATVTQDKAIAALVLIVSFPLLTLPPIVIQCMIRRQIRLLQLGHAAVATVERVAAQNKEGVRVIYRFEAQGVLWKGSTVYAAGTKRTPAPGEQITVLYLPSQPRSNNAASNLRFAALSRGRDLFPRSL